MGGRTHVRFYKNVDLMILHDMVEELSRFDRWSSLIRAFVLGVFQNKRFLYLIFFIIRFKPRQLIPWTVHPQTVDTSSSWSLRHTISQWFFLYCTSSLVKYAEIIGNRTYNKSKYTYICRRLKWKPEYLKVYAETIYRPITKYGILICTVGLG